MRLSVQNPNYFMQQLLRESLGRAGRRDANLVDPLLSR